MLSCLGFNRNTAQAIVFAPRDKGCFELHHMVDGQGFGQASFLLKSWRSQKTLQGRMIHIGVHWAQYTSGVGTPILEAPALKLPHLESKWLQGLWFYLTDVNGLIRLDNPGVPSLQRHHDQYLMDMVLADPKWKPIEIKRINWCRLYLDVTTLSDITNAQGHQLDPGIYYGNLESIPAKCTWQCVNQKKPVLEYIAMYY